MINGKYPRYAEDLRIGLKTRSRGLLPLSYRVICFCMFCTWNRSSKPFKANTDILNSIRSKCLKHPTWNFMESSILARRPERKTGKVSMEEKSRIDQG